MIRAQYIKELKLELSVLQMICELNLVTKDDNLHLIVPLLVRVIQRQNSEQDIELELKVKVVQTLRSLVDCKGFREYIGTIVHTTLKFIEVQLAAMTGPKEADVLFGHAMQLLVYMAKNLKIDFAPFVPLI